MQLEVKSEYLQKKLSQYPNWNREEQIKNNQKALQILRKMIEENQNMSDEEAQLRAEFFEDFKQLIDAYRPKGAKLYSDI